MSTEASSTPLTQLTKKDFVSDQDPRWCPGCGDYAILAQVQKILPELAIPREKFVFVSGIGCSSRFPYYMSTYGFHGIHGRAPALASGIKIANPELSVWVATGDGDALAIGGNHLIHALRRNIDLKILMFNNRIYGLTKGQYSPTSEVGKKTKSTPLGSLDQPFNPLSLALGAEATFVARSVDTEIKHLQEILLRAGRHKGSAFVEIYQNCNVFNDGAFDYVTSKDTKLENQLILKDGEPLTFGKDGKKAIRLSSEFQPELIDLSDTAVDPASLVRHDPTQENPSYAFMLSRLESPNFPVPLGVFRDVSKEPYEERVAAQGRAVVARRGRGDLQTLLRSGDSWTIG